MVIHNCNNNVLVSTCNVRRTEGKFKTGQNILKVNFGDENFKTIWEVQGVVKVTLYMVEFMIIMFEFMIIMLCTMIKTGMKHVVTHGNSELIYC